MKESLYDKYFLYISSFLEIKDFFTFLLNKISCSYVYIVILVKRVRKFSVTFFWSFEHKINKVTNHFFTFSKDSLLSQWTDFIILKLICSMNLLSSKGSFVDGIIIIFCLAVSSFIFLDSKFFIKIYVNSVNSSFVKASLFLFSVGNFFSSNLFSLFSEFVDFNSFFVSSLFVSGLISSVFRTWISPLFLLSSKGFRLLLSLILLVSFFSSCCFNSEVLSLFWFSFILLILLFLFLSKEAILSLSIFS